MDEKLVITMFGVAAELGAVKMFDTVKRFGLNGTTAAEVLNRPERSGMRVMPMRTTPPPAISCLIPCDLACVR